MNATILRFQLRRERVILPIWVIGITALFAASALAITREFGDEQQRAGVVAIAAGNPAFLFLRGLPDGTSVGAVTFFQTFSFLAVLAGLMTVFLVTRHTRAEEDRGRGELILATPVGRASALGGVTVVAVSAHVALGILVTVTGSVLGLEFSGALVTGAALASVGVAFVGVAVLATHIMPSSRGSNGLGAAAVGAAYIVRGVGDAMGTATDASHVSASWLSLLSPIGWAQASRPFAAPQPQFLLVPFLVGCVMVAVAVIIHRRRDLGASLVAERIGRPHWVRASAGGLAYRLQRGTTIAWSVGTVILGLLAGALSPFVLTAVTANEELAALIRRLAPELEVDTGELFAIALLGMCATLAAAAGVQAVLRLRTEEVDGRAELLLSARLSRTGWITRHLAAAVGSTIVVAIAGGLAAGVGFILAGGDLARVGSSLATVAVHLPAAMIFIAVTALVFAVAPRFAVAAGWGMLVLGLIAGQLGDLIGLPGWVQDISPFHHVPAVPMEPVEPAPILIMTAVAVVLAVAAVVGIRRRDIPV